MRKQTDRQRLQLWQNRLGAAEERYAINYEDMERRETLFRGDKSIIPLVPGDDRKEAPHVRNICAELVEAQVSSSLPAPKVTPRRKKDERLAKLIEDFIRNEMDRMPSEEINDLMERLVPTHGGAGYLVEWDSTQRTHTTLGELNISALHPRQILPQDGIYTGIEDMDWIFLKIPQTKEYIRRRYGVDVKNVAEEEPEIKGNGSAGASDDLVTMYCAYYRNDAGGIGLFAWVDDTIVEDLEDYQARTVRVCATCGAPEPLEADPMQEQTLDGTHPDPDRALELPEDAIFPPVPKGGHHPKRCPYCGGSQWQQSQTETEEILLPIYRADGVVIPGVVPVMEAGEELDENGLPIPVIRLEPTRIPSYKPDIYPVILRKNISVYGQFLGESDVEKVASQQNAINRMHAKAVDKLCAAGSFVVLPKDAHLEQNGTDMKTLRLKNNADANFVSVKTLEGEISQDMVYMEQLYQESRQAIGITDSFQGRRDATATSGKAKEFSAAQTAGRLESKRVMKEAAFARLFEAMFKFWLAYSDEPRPVISRDVYGNTVYGELNRYDFLEQDAAGEWYWNDQFIFGCDTSAPLAANREAMWQETRMNFERGAFGNPQDPRTLLLFWTKMEALHYPDAGATKRYFEEELRRQQELAQRQAQQQADMARQQAALAARNAAGQHPAQVDDPTQQTAPAAPMG